jgi:DNA-binding response OmpR family regulator
MVQVLHLEDDIRLREILQVALRAAEPNLELKQYINSNDAVAYLEQHVHEIDLFILDIRVPGQFDGLEVAQMIRNMQCGAPIILTSAYQPPSPNLLMELNSEWYPKPWHIFETTRTLAQVARKYHEERKKAQQEAKDANVKAKLDELKRPTRGDEDTKQLKPITISETDSGEFDKESTQEVEPLDPAQESITPDSDEKEITSKQQEKKEKLVGRMRPVEVPPTKSSEQDGLSPNTDDVKQPDEKQDSADNKDQ